jgi:hypothetical protein
MDLNLNSGIFGIRRAWQIKGKVKGCVLRERKGEDVKEII